MRLDQYPVHRKVIVPWYDSEAACYIVVGLMAMVLGFGLIGIYVAGQTPEYGQHIWLPIVLVLTSAGVMVSIIRRLVGRYLARYTR